MAPGLLEGEVGRGGEGGGGGGEFTGTLTEATNCKEKVGGREWVVCPFG